jgi:hypothetical protein
MSSTMICPSRRGSDIKTASTCFLRPFRAARRLHNEFFPTQIQNKEQTSNKEFDRICQVGVPPRWMVLLRWVKFPTKNYSRQTLPTNQHQSSQHRKMFVSETSDRVRLMLSVIHSAGPKTQQHPKQQHLTVMGQESFLLPRVPQKQQSNWLAVLTWLVEALWTMQLADL